MVTHESIRHWCRKFGAELTSDRADAGHGPAIRGISMKSSSA